MSESIIDAGAGAEDQTSNETNESKKPRNTATSGNLGVLAASSCCILPLVFFILGTTGVTIDNLTSLYPSLPYFLAFIILFLAGGFYKAFRKRKMGSRGTVG